MITLICFSVTESSSVNWPSESSGLELDLAVLEGESIEETGPNSEPTWSWEAVRGNVGLVGLLDGSDANTLSMSPDN